MKLTELKPRLAANGSILIFDCPGCRGHKIRVAISPPMGAGVEKPPTIDGAPAPVWQRSGDSFENLTLAPSIDVDGCCNWHGYVQNGKAMLA